jgi:hypothetical protein
VHASADADRQLVCNYVKTNGLFAIHRTWHLACSYTSSDGYEPRRETGMKYINRSTSARWTTTFAAAASISLAASGFAQTVPPDQPPSQPPAAQATQPPAAQPTQPPPGQAAPTANQDLAKQHLTAARNVLSEVTQLPAAAQLQGETRTQVQQLISNFNELITKDADWRASYAKVETSLNQLLDANEAAPASGTAGAVGTSGSVTAPPAKLDPTIRARLAQFRKHLDNFEAVVDGAGAPSAAAGAAPPTAPPNTAAPPTAPPATAAGSTTTTAATAERPDAPPPADAATSDDQQVTVVAKDLLNHVEAVEVILGAQAAAQKASTAAAGGAVRSAETPSGSTKTTLTGPDVTLNASQLEQINSHLKEIRRLLEKK